MSMVSFFFLFFLFFLEGSLQLLYLPRHTIVAVSVMPAISYGAQYHKFSAAAAAAFEWRVQFCRNRFSRSLMQIMRISLHSAMWSVLCAIDEEQHVSGLQSFY